MSDDLPDCFGPAAEMARLQALSLQGTRAANLKATEVTPIHPRAVYAASQEESKRDIEGFIKAINASLVQAAAHGFYGSPLRLFRPFWTPRHPIHPKAEGQALDAFGDVWNLTPGSSPAGETWIDFRPRE